MPPLINFSGLASGIDSAALIEALLDQQRSARIDPLERKATNLQSTNSSLEELSTLLSELNSTTSTFRTLNGGPVSKTATSSDSTVADVVASDTASPGTYSVNVSQLASNATFSFDDRFGSTTSAIDAGINDVAPAGDRTVSFTVGTGGGAENVNVVLTSTSTATDFVTDFNSQSEKATASLVNTGTSAAPSYAIVINSDEAGEEDGTITLNSVGPEISIFATNTLDQATNAEFTVDGISGTFSRSSNVINNVLPGLTLDLKDTGSTTVTVGVDTEKTETGVQEFVDKYNEIVDFIYENDLIERVDEGGDSEVIFGTLSNTSLDENLLQALRGAFSDSGISGGSVNILADLGITTNRDGTLDFDSDDFVSALQDSPDDVDQILRNLGENLSAVDGTIATFTRFNGLIDLSTDSNQSLIDDLNDRIFRTEDNLSQQESRLNARFAHLESLIGKLQSQQSTLGSILGSLG